jgi:hypothetical protein
MFVVEYMHQKICKRGGKQRKSVRAETSDV